MLLEINNLICYHVYLKRTCMKQKLCKCSARTWVHYRFSPNLQKLIITYKQKHLGCIQLNLIKKEELCWNMHGTQDIYIPKCNKITLHHSKKNIVWLKLINFLDIARMSAYWQILKSKNLRSLDKKYHLSWLK